MNMPTAVDWLIGRQHASARQYALARELYAKHVRISRARPLEESIAMSLALLQTDAAEASRHIRFALGIESSCSCQEHEENVNEEPE